MSKSKKNSSKRRKLITTHSSLRVFNNKDISRHLSIFLLTDDYISLKNLNKNTNTSLIQDKKWYQRYYTEHKIGEIECVDWGTDQELPLRELRRLVISSVLIYRQWDKMMKWHKESTEKRMDWSSIRCPSCFQTNNLYAYFSKEWYIGRYCYEMNPFMACDSCLNKGEHNYSSHIKDRQYIYIEIDAIYKYDLKPSELKRYPSYKRERWVNGNKMIDTTYYMIRPEKGTHISRYDSVNW